MTIAYIGLGSNIGDREKNIKEAISILDKDGRVSVKKRSAQYETKPVGGPIQRDYYNCVVEVETVAEPLDLLVKIKGIEKALGRKTAGRNFPRIIDLDILMQGELVVENENLIIPHPRMHERVFVLKGFSEIAPDAVHPTTGKTIRELYEEALSKEKTM